MDDQNKTPIGDLPFFSGKYAFKSDNLSTPSVGHISLHNIGLSPIFLKVAVSKKKLKTLNDLLMSRSLDFLYSPTISNKILSEAQATVKKFILSLGKTTNLLIPPASASKEPVICDTHMSGNYSDPNICDPVAVDPLVGIYTSPFFIGQHGSLVSSKELRGFIISQFIYLFSVRFQNCLQKMSTINNLEDIVNTDYTIFLKLRNCGTKTIIDARKVLQEIANDVHMPIMIEKQALYAEEKEQIPFFLRSSYHLDQAIPKNILDLSISQIDFPIKFKNFMESHKEINTVEDLLAVNSHDILRTRGMGKVTLHLVQKILFTILSENVSKNLTINSHDEIRIKLDELIANRIVARINNDRNSSICLMRLAFNRDFVPTLDDIAQQFGLTRERVRQIEDKQEDRINKIPNIFAELAKILVSGDYIQEFNQLIDQLIKDGLWSETNRLFLRQLLIGPFAKSKTVSFDGEYLLIRNLSTINSGLKLIKRSLIQFVKFRNEGVVIEIACQNLFGKCQFDSIESNKLINPATLSYLAKRSEQIHIVEDILYNKMRYNILFGRGLENVAYWALKYHGERMHFTQLAEYIRANNANYRNVSYAVIHGALVHSNRIHDVERGVYALKETNLPKHITAGQALLRLLRDKGPVLLETIFFELGKCYSVWNIKMAIENNRHKLIEIGNDMYDLREKNG